MWILHGNVTECGDVGASPGRSYLFFLTAYHPGIGLSGDGVLWLEEAGNINDFPHLLNINKDGKDQ